MPYSSFTVKFSYPQSTHKFDFDQTNLYIRLKSDNSAVKTLGLGAGVNIRINSGNVETGTINGINGSFPEYLDFTLPHAGIIYDESNNKVIGTNDTSDNNVTKYNYIIGNTNCPIKIQKDLSTSQVTITAICDSSDCSNNPKNSSFSQQN